MIAEWRCRPSNLGGNSRRRKSSDQEEEDEPSSGEREEEYSLSEIARVQHLRERKKGIELSIFGSSRLPSSSQPLETTEIIEGGGGDPGMRLLDKNFSSAGGIRKDFQSDPLLDEYLRERLRPQQTGAGDVAVPAKKNREDELYEIPLELQVRDSTAEHAEKTNWMTGLVEVSLPIEYKVRNIEATEKAKRELLSGKPSATDWIPKGILKPPRRRMFPNSPQKERQEKPTITKSFYRHSGLASMQATFLN